MALTPEHTIGMLSQAREHWIGARARSLAYEREKQRVLRLGNLLNWGTIAGALLTAMTSALPAAASTGVAAGGLGWLPVVAGLVTAVVATCDKVFTPGSKAVALNDTMKVLERARSELATFALKLNTMSNLDDAVRALEQVHQRIQNADRDASPASHLFEATAGIDFERSTIHSLLFRAQAPGQATRGLIATAPEPEQPATDDAAEAPLFDDSDDDVQTGLADDAPDLVTTMRHPRRLQS